jgi:hypothetical protein
MTFQDKVREDKFLHVLHQTIKFVHCSLFIVQDCKLTSSLSTLPATLLNTLAASASSAERWEDFDVCRDRTMVSVDAVSDILLLFTTFTSGAGG